MNKDRVTLCSITGNEGFVKTLDVLSIGPQKDYIFTIPYIYVCFMFACLHLSKHN